MTDLEFMDRAEALLNAIELTCDQVNETRDCDIDVQRNGGVITLTFENRSQIVVNLQKPLHEVWLAARSGGYHYRMVDGWQDTKGGLPFFDRLSEAASQQAGQALQFTAP
jgi:CyaY protein